MKENNVKTLPPAAPHKLDISDRKSASLTGVVKVESASDGELVLLTTLGELEVKGSELKISRFDEGDGSFSFTGNIDSVKYKQTKPPLIKRIFK